MHPHLGTTRVEHVHRQTDRQTTNDGDTRSTDNAKRQTSTCTKISLLQVSLSQGASPTAKLRRALFHKVSERQLFAHVPCTRRRPQDVSATSRAPTGLRPYRPSTWAHVMPSAASDARPHHRRRRLDAVGRNDGGLLRAWVWQLSEPQLRRPQPGAREPALARPLWWDACKRIQRGRAIWPDGPTRHVCQRWFDGGDY